MVVVCRFEWVVCDKGIDLLLCASADYMYMFDIKGGDIVSGGHPAELRW